MHGKDCRPSRSQLVVEKRKVSSYTRSVNESQIKTNLTLLMPGERVPARAIRRLILSLFPPGHSLDYQQLTDLRYEPAFLFSTTRF
jgi:hypothetical protein